VVIRSDDDVLARSLVDPGAFGDLFDRHARVVHAYVGRRLGDGLADDVVAETFRIAFERRATFDPELGEVRTWLFGIATNVIRQHARAEERRLRALGSVRPVSDQSHGSTVDIGESLARLESSDREVVVLIAWEDMTYQQAADVLGIPIGTVRSRLNRARTQLRNSLAQEEKRHG
jgi:RNA polymerase sigma factor (sigma-70 family)